MNELKVEQTDGEQLDITIELNKEENLSSKPFSYSSLLDKLRAEAKPDPNSKSNTDVNKELVGKSNDIKQNKEKFNKKKLNSKTQTNSYKLSTSEYMEELKKCQKTFFNYLGEYLKEEVNVKVEDSEPVSKKNPVKFIKKTNLVRIQSGSVNIIKAVKQMEKDDDLKYLDNLIRNRSIDFVQTLRTNMEKFGLMTTFRNKDIIWVHSPYIKI